MSIAFLDIQYDVFLESVNYFFAAIDVNVRTICCDVAGAELALVATDTMLNV